MRSSLRFGQETQNVILLSEGFWNFSINYYLFCWLLVVLTHQPFSSGRSLFPSFRTTREFDSSSPTKSATTHLWNDFYCYNKHLDTQRDSIARCSAPDVCSPASIARSSQLATHGPKEDKYCHLETNARNECENKRRETCRVSKKLTPARECGRSPPPPPTGPLRRKHAKNTGQP